MVFVMCCIRVKGLKVLAPQPSSFCCGRKIMDIYDKNSRENTIHEEVLKKMMSPPNRSISQLAKEEGIIDADIIHPAGNYTYQFELPRDCRRLHTLRRWSHEYQHINMRRKFDLLLLRAVYFVQERRSQLSQEDPACFAGVSGLQRCPRPFSHTKIKRTALR